MNLYKTVGAAILAVGLTTSAFAVQDNQENTGKQQWKRGHRMGAAQRGGMMFGRAAAELNLTHAQKQYAKQLMQDSRTQAKPLREQLKQNRQELEAAIKSNNTGLITQLTERQADLRGQISALHAKSMASFYAQLTPEQKAKAEELKAQRQQRFENRRQNRQNATPRNNG
jgi:Spy/CpxP family protein refolding chaperone